MTTWIRAPGFEYRLTPEDVEWATRGALAEGGLDPLAPADALWCWAQRLVAMAERGDTMRLASLVRAHSQPVNPRWRADGDFCRPGSEFHGAEPCAPERLAKREFWQTSSFAQALSARPERVPIVQAWFRAEVPNDVPRAIDFADQVQGPKYLARHEGSVLVKGSPRNNFFIADWQALEWPADHVSVASDVGGRLLVATAVRDRGAPNLVAAVTQGFFRWWRTT